MYIVPVEDVPEQVETVLDMVPAPGIRTAFAICFLKIASWAQAFSISMQICPKHPQNHPISTDEAGKADCLMNMYHKKKRAWPVDGGNINGWDRV